jgi:hypothetical protein
MKLETASKSKSYMRVALQGASGSGKTYSALRLAFGLTRNDNIAIVDTENGSAHLYSSLGNYQVLQLTSPFTPERYKEAIDVCVANGIETIVIDSLSHEWEGNGGILEMHGSSTGSNSFANWAKITPRHNALIQHILNTPAHVIATLRSKQEYALKKDDRGRSTPEKLGMKPIQRDGIDYEFTTVLSVDMNHKAVAVKDRTGLFPLDTPFTITEEVGKRLLQWSREEVVQPSERAPQQPAALSNNHLNEYHNAYGN